MIGQEKLLKQFMTFDINTMPHSILLLGDEGCGKHLLVNTLAAKLNVSVIDITDNINLDNLTELSLSTCIKIATINCNNTTIREQNILLKTLEETMPCIYFVLISTTKNIILDTIINRCVVYEFEAYTQEELIRFIETRDALQDKEIILDICSTPGQIEKLNKNSIKDLENICTLIIDKLSKASLNSTLSILDKINFKEDYDKYDPKTFLRYLRKRYFEEYKNNNKCYANYEIVNKALNKLILDARLNAQHLMTQTLLALWKLEKGIE